MTEPVNQNGQEDQQIQGEELQPEALSTPQEPAVGNDPELPEDAKERTRKEFEKLKEHNAELKKQLEKQQRQNIPSVLDYLSSPAPEVSLELKQQYFAPVQPKVEQTPEPEPQLVDEQGYVNAEVLKKELDKAKEATKRIEEAERKAREAEERISRFEINNETQALYKSYPELDPQSDEFNQDAYDLVRNEITSQIVNSGRRDAIQAANKMSKYFRQVVSQTPAKVLQTLDQRKQATTMTGSAPRPISGEDLDQLKLRSRRDPDAVNERLKRLGL